MMMSMQPTGTTILRRGRDNAAAMCFAIPGKVIKLDAKSQTAVVDYEAEQRTVSTALLPDVKPGDYVLVQAKMIVQRVPAEDAKKVLDALREAP